MMKGKKYTALEIVTAAFPKGVEMAIGAEVEHEITQADLDANEGLENDVKVGDKVLLPSIETIPVAEVFGKYGVNIGGVSGIVSPDHKIMVSESAENLIVFVGRVSAEVPLEEYIADAEPIHVEVKDENTPAEEPAA